MARNGKTRVAVDGHGSETVRALTGRERNGRASIERTDAAPGIGGLG